MKNWETIEIDLIISNTEGFYFDILNGVDVQDIVDGNKHLFDHVDLKEVDFNSLREQYKEHIMDINSN